MSKRFPAEEGDASSVATKSGTRQDSPVLIVDAMQRCVEVNESATQLLGLTRSQIVGRAVDSLRLPEGHLLVLPRIEDGSESTTWNRRPSGEGRARRPSGREREVLALLARGSTDAQIAEALGLSPATVQTHVRNAKAKLGARTRAQAVALALVSGLIEID